MATYIIGDVHGRYNEFILLLKQINFSPKKDTLWLTGDLVGRGSYSLEVLRYVKSLGNSVKLVLGNHDLYLISIYASINYNKFKYCINNSLKVPDISSLIHWLRYQPLLQIDEEKKLIMTHAGIFPKWNLDEAKQYAYFLEKIITGEKYLTFLNEIFNNSLNNLNQKMDKTKSLRFIFNVFTRMRYCFSNGQLDMNYKDSPKKAPKTLKPWFNIPNSITKKYSIVFGHWSSLEGKGTPDNIYALDTGCCWGKKLTCLRWEDKTYFFQSCNL